MASSSEITLYHYTTVQGAEAIGKTKKIIIGTGHAVFGTGVYFTDMSPHDFTESEVVKNNYIHFTPKLKEKVARVVVVTMPNKPPLKKIHQSNRSVYLYEGTDVNLTAAGFHYKIETPHFKPEHMMLMMNAPAADMGVKTIEDLDDSASSGDLHIWLAQF